MNVSTRLIRAALHDVWAQCLATQPPPANGYLRSFLITTAVSARQLVSAGAIKMSSADGHITSFAIGAHGVQITPENVVEVWEYLVDEYDRAKTELGGNPTDTQIEALMEANLRPIMGYTSNFMYLSKLLVLTSLLSSGCTMVDRDRVFPKFTWYWTHDAKVQRFGEAQAKEEAKAWAKTHRQQTQ